MKEPTTITKRNRAERRLSPESLVNILKSEPTRSAIHDGAGLYLDNRSNSRGTNGLRVGYWYHQYAEMDGGKRKPRTISIGPTDKVGAPSAPTRPATTDKAILKSTAATLVAARKRNDEIHDLRQSGLDPRAEQDAKRRAEKEKINPFSLAAAWPDYIKNRPATTHASYGIFFKKDIAPLIGDKEDSSALPGRACVYGEGARCPRSQGSRGRAGNLVGRSLKRNLPHAI